MNNYVINELKKLSILCVEDEDGIRQRVINTLSYYFDSIYEAKSGNEGYLIYKEKSPDIILCDIQMNDGNGIELVENIREEDKKTIILMLTAYNTEEFLMQLINLNINHFILKPLNNKKLEIAFEKIVKKVENNKLILSENISLDLLSRELIYKKERVLIRKREKDFLELLYNNKSKQLTTYLEIEDTIWENKEMSNSALKSFIKELRQKLPEDILINVSQEGYKLG